MKEIKYILHDGSIFTISTKKMTKKQIKDIKKDIKMLLNLKEA